MSALSIAASALKSTAELESSGEPLERWEAIFGLAALLAAKSDVAVDLAVSLASAIVNFAMNETQIYLLAKSISQLNKLNEDQMKALEVRSANVRHDVQALRQAKAQLAQCTTAPPPSPLTSGQVNSPQDPYAPLACQLAQNTLAGVQAGEPSVLRSCNCIVVPNGVPCD